MRRLLTQVAVIVLLGAVVGAAGALAISTVFPGGRTDPTTHAGQSTGRAGGSPAQEGRATPATGRSPQPANSPSPSSSPTASEPPAKPIPVVAARAYDPMGDGHEHDAEIPLTIDGKAATVWTTEHYSTAEFGNLKPGVGVLLDLGKPRAVDAIHLRQLPGGGSTLQLRAGNATGSLADLPVIATVGSTGRTSTVRPPEPTTARYWLMWFTSLPAQEEHYRGGISEIRLSG